ncbi:glycosyltransferase family 2 protein [uncultured Pseudoteredinibacter sp.]|uniref:glycosyltransferase family 2 protein n=1 Tax=uncultured Pseudoteredinibacter sp. TaxID=1641701 RepID=UPI002607BB2B|nr:glycosyltransferase family 2 protein [uncultured Pseudoteredinibacter sp.]
MKNEKLISIIAPAYNEAEVLPEFVKRCVTVLKSMSGFNYELVLINDGSKDSTLAVMRKLKKQFPDITIVNLSRNFGKEIAMTAGLSEASGDAMVVIDTDLQDPPELIPKLVEKWQEGFDTVYAKRKSREGETWLKKVTAKAFYSFMQNVGSTPIPPDVGDFRLISRRVTDALLQLPEKHRFMKGLFSWVGFPDAEVEYERDARFAGETKWNYWKLWNFAIEGFTSFTIAPLKIASYIGFITAMSAFVYGLFVLFKAIIWGDSVQGFPTIMVSMLFLGGVQLLVLGVIGEYLGRAFNEVKQRPLYLLESVDRAQSVVSVNAQEKSDFEKRVA